MTEFTQLDQQTQRKVSYSKQCLAFLIYAIGKLNLFAFKSLLL